MDELDMQHVLFEEYLEHVKEEERRVERGLLQRQRIASCRSPAMHAYVLDEVREKLIADRRTPEKNRAKAFAELSREDLGVLEYQLEAYREHGMLVMRSDPVIRKNLQALRINQVMKQIFVSGGAFRALSDALYERYTRIVLEELRKTMPDLMPEEHMACILPLRASLIGAPAWQRAGMKNFGIIGVSRNEKGAHPETPYYKRPPVMNAKVRIGVIEDPMLATAGTIMEVVKWFLELGLPESSIVVQSLVAAPEGIELLHMAYPAVRVFAATVDGGLDGNAYIKNVGIGDCGDHGMRDMNDDLALRLWHATGILTREECSLVVQRTKKTAGIPA